MWTKSENSSSAQPQDIEFCGNIVIIRKGFVLIPETDEASEHWQYDEWQMTREQYDVYCAFKPQIDEQSDALVELAELISEVI